MHFHVAISERVKDGSPRHDIITAVGMRNGARRHGRLARRLRRKAARRHAPPSQVSSRTYRQPGAAAGTAARAQQYTAGTLDRESLAAIENAAIARVVKLQEELAL